MMVFSRKRSFCLLGVLIFLFVCAQCASAAKDSGRQNPAPSGLPFIHISDFTYDFGEVMEGTEVEHDFIVKNTGLAVLNIERVKTGWGCSVARFDRAIPPGGEGKITLKVNLKGFQGKVSKTATVYSDDPQNPQVPLKVVGQVVALIDVKPSTAVVFRGMADQVPETVLDMVGSSVPFHFTTTESNLNENVSYTMDTVQDGKHYRLRVANKTKRGNYTGYIKLNTDLPQKPDVLIRVSGFMEGEVSVKPLTILVGKLSANQPERSGRVTVTGNRETSFEITKLGYDDNLVSVTHHPLENERGFSIEISPKLSGVPVGSRRQTTLTIETSLSQGQKDTVQIHLFNSADQPEAQTAPR